jgi:DNA-binding MarR family transcriptional regulator
MSSQTVKQWPGQKEKTARAFQAYLDLLDAAEYMKARVYDQFTFYELTMRGFRVLELLHRQGPTPASVMARTCQWNRQNQNVIVKNLARNGWVQSELVSVNEADADESAPADQDGSATDGRRVSVLSLTEEGEKFAARFLPRHAKVVKAYMRALGGREQRTLSQLCRKLREGDVNRFISEMEHEDVED